MTPTPLSCHASPPPTADDSHHDYSSWRTSRNGDNDSDLFSSYFADSSLRAVVHATKVYITVMLPVTSQTLLSTGRKEATETPPISVPVSPSSVHNLQKGHPFYVYFSSAKYWPIFMIFSLKMAYVIDNTSPLACLLTYWNYYTGSLLGTSLCASITC